MCRNQLPRLVDRDGSLQICARAPVLPTEASGLGCLHCANGAKQYTRERCQWQLSHPHAAGFAVSRVRQLDSASLAALTAGATDNRNPLSGRYCAATFLALVCALWPINRGFRPVGPAGGILSLFATAFAKLDSLQRARRWRTSGSTSAVPLYLAAEPNSRVFALNGLDDVPNEIPDASIELFWCLHVFLPRFGFADGSLAVFILMKP